MGISKKDINHTKINQAALDFKKGDIQSFNYLFSYFKKAIYRFCLRILGDEASAQDAFQETFIRVYERISTFNGGNFESWLFITARNTCINFIRKRKNTQAITELDYGFAPKNYLKIGMKEYIELQLAKLPLSLREAVVLRDMEDFSYKEIAEILDIDLSLAKVRVHRARLKLKETLEPLMRELNETA